MYAGVKSYSPSTDKLSLVYCPALLSSLFICSFEGAGGGLMLFVIVLVFPMYNSMILTLRG